MPPIYIPDTWLGEPIKGAMERVVGAQRQPNAGLAMPPMKMHYVEFIERIEHLVRAAVRSCCPNSWDEDHITFSIIEHLGALGHVEVAGLHRPFKITWDARKLRGPTETALGDLGVHVRIVSWDGEQIKGIGLLEAKKRCLASSSFDAVRKNQLTRILTKAPRSRLLLYDHSSITEFTDNIAMAFAGHRFDPWDDSFGPHEWISACSYSQAVAVPMNLAATVGTYKTQLYKYSLPLSLQLCARYFRGLDLEFDPRVLQRVERYIEGAGGPRYLLIVGVSTGPNPPPPPGDLFLESYEPLGERHG